MANQYGPNGEPGLVYQGRNQGRIRYTGQLYIPELAPWGGPAQPLYSYKARIYAPNGFLTLQPFVFVLPVLGYGVVRLRRGRK